MTPYRMVFKVYAKNELSSINIGEFIDILVWPSLSRNGIAILNEFTCRI